MKVRYSSVSNLCTMLNLMKAAELLHLQLIQHFLNETAHCANDFLIKILYSAPLYF